MGERNFQEEAVQEQERAINIIIDAVMEMGRIEKASRWEKQVDRDRTIERDIEW